MVRKPQKGAPALPNRDHLERAHFALQASVFLQELGLSAGSSSDSASASSPSGHPTPSNAGNARALPAPHADLPRLAHTHMRAFRKWTVHNLVKLDPSFKHALCACNAVLVPGLTARVRVRPGAHGHVVSTTCGCGRRVGVPAAPRLSSSSSSTAPEPARVEGGELDGPVRAARRRRRARMVPFHRRERADDGEVETGKKAKAKAKGLAGPVRDGHVLWAGGERVSGWGEMVDEAVVDQDAPGEEPPQTMPEPKKQKQTQREKQQKQKPPDTPKDATPDDLEELAHNG
ncbi:hypothetical protein CC85DRAFT_284503 [Cutaneotrichosporon oleaginosum]|uniref:Rpr2-domain-containing protein n=1 Tax=Cutaneotrichosporon oleaginosum TaxID=879819 RepID=A0A0J0XR57_9TREE|nr:uncharacterized protein CC85DRAFT_284503 [Cutaneotrichosporon oleaginosum]KLT43578.1 hypothetical protein CC85DRAFT_284503 [Cutaneotrichosporon oleaginosum]TXT05524.1 hypothetical protein COLE_06844 [Cutaneotrichosporon oleaginosum]